MRRSLCLLPLVSVFCLLHISSAAPLSTDMDQMEEMEELGLVGCNHAVTVTALPLPGFTLPNPEQRHQADSKTLTKSEDGFTAVNPEQRHQAGSKISTESKESDSASGESSSVRDMRTENR